MSKYTQIEKELQAINEAKFQQICNAYLYVEHKGELHSPGTVEGKEKTRKGKPDSYIRHEDGSYTLTEATTKDSSDRAAFLEKLENDLRDCLAFEELGIESEQVRLIILFCNSSVVPAEREYLEEIADSYKLKVVGIDTLTLFLMDKGKNTARDLLNIGYETGQVLTKEQFLDNYQKRNLSTPLTNSLIGREKEVEELLEMIDESPIVLIKGSTGVGKSRLALHVIDEFIRLESQYIPYYIFPRNNSITEDLITFLEPEKKYILFIDDANRQLDNFLAILHNQLEKEKGRIKIVMTVRDYAKEEVISLCGSLHPKIFEVKKLSSEVIRTILKDFSVTKSALVNRIEQISGGNPRIAIMAALTVKDNADINVLTDVSTIYDEYFQNLIFEKNVFKNREIVKALGLLSYFNSLNLESEDARTVLKDFEIPFDQFVDIMHQMQDIEIVDIYKNYTVKISEQVLGTYFFYKVFIKEQVLRFSLLLNIYFEKSEWRMRDSFYPANSAFGSNNVFERVKEDLRNYYNKVHLDEEKALFFLNIFGKYMPSIVFPYVMTAIHKLPALDPIHVFQSKGNYSSAYHNPILRLLEPYYSSHESNELLSSLELSIQYVQRKHDVFHAFSRSLKEHLTITGDDGLKGLKRQEQVFKYLLDSIHTNGIIKYLFYNIYQSIILDSHYPIEVFARNASDKWELSPSFRCLREEYWNALNKNFSIHPIASHEALMLYLDGLEYSNKILIPFDGVYLRKIIHECLDPERFADCFFVHQYWKLLKNKKIKLSSLNSIKKKFTSYGYQISTIVAWDRDEQHKMHIKYRKFEKVYEYKQKLIERKLSVGSLKEFKQIYFAIAEILDFQYQAKYHLHPLMDVFLASIFKSNPELGFRVIKFYLAGGNKAREHPWKLFKAIHDNGGNWYKKLYKLIDSIRFPYESSWKDVYLQILPEKEVNPATLQILYKFHQAASNSIELNLNLLDKFLSVEPELYKKVLEIMVGKRELDANFKYKVPYNFFSTHTEIVDQHRALCIKVYFHQEETENYYDLECTEFMVFYVRDTKFLFDYIEYLYSRHEVLFLRHFKELEKLWLDPGAEEIIYKALIKLNKLHKFHVNDHIATIFFTNLDEEFHDRAFELLKKMIVHHPIDEKALNMVFDIGRNCLKKYYHELIRYFLRLNPDMKLFKRIEWYNNHFSSSGDVLWSDFKSAELKKIYDAIKQLPDPITYWPHLDYIGEMIGREERESERERKLRFMGFR